MLDLHPITVPTDGVLHTQNSTVCHVDKHDIGNGTLYITSSNLCWVGEEGRGFVINYQSLSVHAISRHLSSFPHPCIYMMATNLSCAYQKLVSDNEGERENEGGGMEDEGVDDDDGGDDDDGEEKVIEIRFVPSDPAALEAMYEGINKGSALNPYDDSNSEDDNFEPRREEGQGDQNLLNGHFDDDDAGVGDDDDGQFENADDDDAMHS